MAIFDLDTNSDVAVVVCIGDGSTHDLMGMVMRDGPDQPWYYRYRFRYYDGGPVDDPEALDTKNVYEMRAKSEENADAARAELVKAALTTVEVLQQTGFGDNVQVLHHNGGPLDELMKRLQQTAFFHKRVVH